jgi:hypothetical protein
MSWGKGLEGFWWALSHPGFAGGAAFLIVLLAGAVLAMWATRAFAFPWSGIGDDLESFEDVVAFLRLWWFPIILFAVCGVLLLIYFWPAIDPPKPQPPGLAAAVSELKRAIEKASERLPDGEVRRQLDRIEASLRQLSAQQPVSPPPELRGAIRDLASALDRLAGAMGGLEPGKAADKVVQAIGEAATKLAAAFAGSDQTKGLAAVASELQEIRKYIASIAAAPAPPDLAKPLATIAGELHETGAGVSRPLETIASRLQATESDVARIAAAPAPPDPAEPLAAITGQLRAIDRDMPKITPPPAPPEAANSKPPPPKPENRPPLGRGARGQPVKELQQKLRLRPDDGIFGTATERAVRRFQHDHELVPDGIVGPLTWAAL